MRDFEATPIAPAFWKLRALPDKPVVVERIDPGERVKVAEYSASREAEIVPKLGELGKGLFLVTSWFSNGDKTQMRQDYYLIFGPFSILSLSGPLGAAIEGATAPPKEG